MIASSAASRTCSSVSARCNLSASLKRDDWRSARTAFEAISLARRSTVNRNQRARKIVIVALVAKVASATAALIFHDGGIKTYQLAAPERTIVSIPGLTPANSVVRI